VVRSLSQHPEKGEASPSHTAALDRRAGGVTLACGAVDRLSLSLRTAQTLEPPLEQLPQPQLARQVPECHFLLLLQVGELGLRLHQLSGLIFGFWWK